MVKTGNEQTIWDWNCTVQTQEEQLAEEGDERTNHKNGERHKETRSKEQINATLQAQIS